MENIIDRLVKLMDYKLLNANKMTVEVGLSVGLIGKAIKNKKGLHSDTIEKILNTYRDISPSWFVLGEGKMLLADDNSLLIKRYDNIKDNNDGIVEDSGISIYKNKTDYLVPEQYIPVYDGTVTAGMLPVLDDINSKKPIDHLYIPNAPKCDGAIYAFGDSMYPLIKSGDLIAYKIIKDIKNDLYWGLKYILYIQQGDDVHRTIKFVKKGSDLEHINLVSENRHHGEKEIHISKVVAIAQVKLTVRID